MILIVTQSADFYVPELVADSLAKRNVSSLRINTDEFPLRFCLSQTINAGGSALEFSRGGSGFSFDSVQGAWLRKFWDPQLRPDIDPVYKDGCLRESKEVLDIFLHALADHSVIDPYHVTQRASNKFLQLQTARQCGLEIPETLITNDPQKLNDFYQERKSEIIAKMLTPLSTNMQGHTDFFVYTSMVNDSHLNDADALRDCPMTFQEYIEKEYELRIIYVDGSFFTGKIDASRTPKGKTDWRRAKPGEVSWEHYRLPDEPATKLTAFMNRMGLAYGAIDMIKSVTGKYVFLEVNTHGEWGMLQRDLDYPISDAIASALIKRIKK